ncbi:protein HEG homolog 1 isoform X1 [Manis javanica]|uniref:protein HEG homolog 1 isoform X1 n=1 Tax=Manis javanica TaxID=9974 RepID=UPI003C6CD21B
MASPRASRGPPPLLLLLLLLPAAPGTRGRTPSPARGGPESEPPPPTPPGPGQAGPAPGAATRPGPSGRAPRGGSAAPIRNHWSENNTEPHTENIAFDQNQVDFSTVVSKEDVVDQTPGNSQPSSNVPEDFTPQTEPANARGRSGSLRRADFTISPVGPEEATALTSQGVTSALGKRHLLSSNSGLEGRTAPSHMESMTSQGPLMRRKGLPEEVTVHTQVAATSGLSQSSLPALEVGEETIPSRRSSLEPEPSWLPSSRTLAFSLPSDHSAASGSVEELSSPTALRSPSVSELNHLHAATTVPRGVPRMLQSLAVSLGPLNEAQSFMKDSEIATTSVSVHSLPSEAELGRNSEVIGSVGDGEFEPSTENGFGLTSPKVAVGFWQHDSPTLGGHQLASSSDAENASPMSHTEAVSRSVPSVKGGEDTARWVLTNSEAFTDVTESSSSYPDVGNTSVLTQFSASAPQSRGSDTALGDRSYSELATESLSSSSSESLDASAPRGERSTTEDSPERRVSAVAGEAPSRRTQAGALSAHTSAAAPGTVAGTGELALRSLSNASTTLGAAGRSATAPREAESATPHGNGTGAASATAPAAAHLGTGSLAASHTLGVTGISHDQVSGTDIDQRTSSDRTDHTYVTSAITKGERALLSIADNSSSWDIRENSTSSVKISNSSHSNYSFFSPAQTERSNVSSYEAEHAQPSTESLVLHAANPPSYTPAMNTSDTTAFLDVDAGWAGGASSLGPPLPPPSVSQSHQIFSSILATTRASAHAMQSSPDAPTSLSSSPPPLPVSLTASTPSSLSTAQTTVPPSPSTLAMPRAKDSPVMSVWTSTVALSTAALPISQTADPENQSSTHPEKVVTELKPPNLESLPTEATEAVTARSTSGFPMPTALREASAEPALPATGASVAQMSPALTTTALKTSQPPMTTPSPPTSIAALMADSTPVQTTAEKQLFPTRPEILAPQISTEGAVTTKRSRVHVDASTRLIPLTSVPTTRLGITEEHSPASHFLRTSSAQSTGVPTAEAVTPKSTTLTAQSSTEPPTELSPPASVNSCATSPCRHDGKCVVDPTSHGYRCVCSPSWQGDDCSVDVNECLLNPCPPLAMCNNTQGSFTCKCPVGYQLEKGICNLVRTFVTEFKLKKTFLNTTVEKHSDLHEVENEITKTLNMCFSMLPGYTRSAVQMSRESSMVVLSLQTTFSLASNVTLFDLADGIQKCVNSCRSSAEVCQLLGSQRRIFRAGSLCKRKTPECDKETSICTDLDGVALCQCKSGYFQFNKMDHSCRACEDGYRLENETCMSCPFGLGGLNCGNPYQLITVVIAAAGGGLLLVLGVALIVTCCRKNKNDISKLIFKSGDFQMSPYAEYPKNPRSQEWGREAIEMHENGSTKNLLQMTDVCYLPTGVRNPELERNGLYPAYTGLPGSRHSCIFPGQYNPSFISDESRRRDYF